MIAHTTARKAGWAGLSKLLVSVAVLLGVWLGVLPRIARIPAVDSHLQVMREHHVDAGAMFYSELDPRLFPNGEMYGTMQVDRRPAE